MTATGTRVLRSYSQLSTYLGCPAAYKLKYIDRVPEEPAVWSVGGTAFHSCAEWYLRGDLGDDPEGHRIRDAWDAAWQIAEQEVTTKHPDVPLNQWRAADKGRENAVWWENEGPRMVSRFIEWRRGRGKDLTTLDLGWAGDGLETRLEVELGGVPVVAIPDWLAIDEHNQVVIVDYKSSRRPQPPGHLQLGVYKAAVILATGLTPVWGMYYMTRQGSVDLRDLSTWTPEQIGQMFADFETNVQAGRFDPRPGHRCLDCRTTH